MDATELENSVIKIRKAIAKIKIDGYTFDKSTKLIELALINEQNEQLERIGDSLDNVCSNLGILME